MFRVRLSERFDMPQLIYNNKYNIFNGRVLKQTQYQNILKNSNWSIGTI